jgi:hypothetical protein
MGWKPSQQQSAEECQQTCLQEAVAAVPSPSNCAGGTFLTPSRSRKKEASEWL